MIFVSLRCRFYKPLVFMMCVVMPTITPWLFWGETMWNSYFISCILRYTVILNCTWLVNSAAHMWGKETKTFYL